MFNKIFFLKGVVFLVVLSAVSISSAEENNIIVGAEVVNNNCSRCHNSRAIDEFSLEEWSVIVPHMRDKAHLTGEESNAVLGFFQSFVRTTRIVPNDLSIVRSGEELMTAYACIACHSFGGVGGGVAPALDSTVSVLGEDYVRKKLQNPKFNNSSTPMPTMNITEAETETLINYLRGS